FLRGRIDHGAVERNSRLEILVVGGVFPHRSSTAAEAHDAEAVGVAALRLCPRHRGVEVGEELGVRLGVDDRHELRDLGDLGEVHPFAEIVVGCDGEGAELAEPRVTSFMYSCSPKISIATRMTGGFCTFAGLA